MNRQTIILIGITLLLCIVVAILYWPKKEGFSNLSNKDKFSNASYKEGFSNKGSYKEGFQEPLVYNSAQVDYEFNDMEFPPSIYETSVMKEFGTVPTLACNLIPTRKADACSINGVPIVKFKFPVHVIKLITGSHLAVFNDGRLYMKDKLTDSMWRGPLKNSMPNRNIPLRMVTMDPSGTKLIAVGFDNKAYIKLSDETANLKLETEWVELPGLTNIIFLMYMFDGSIDMNRYLVIDVAGKIKVSQSSDSNSGLTDYGVLKDPILKLMYGADGYMFAIDTTFRLRTFDNKEWGVSQFSKKYGPNPTRVIDVIYDKDQLLFGCVLLPNAGVAELMKQEDLGYISPFVPFELNKYLTGGMESRLSDRFIVYSKMGIYTAQGLLEEEALDDDINMAYQRQMLLDKKRLREFCASRGMHTDESYRNYEILRQVENNKNKIDRLNGIIAELISFDPDQKPIQESIMGINFMQDQVKKADSGATGQSSV